MNTKEYQQELEKTSTALKKVQDFDANTLPRVEELGKALNFEEAVKPATLLIDFYRRISLEVLTKLPQRILNQIRTRAESDYNILSSILQYDAGSGKRERDQLIANLIEAYNITFQQLHPVVAYSHRTSEDVSAMLEEGRKKLHELDEKMAEYVSKMEHSKKEAEDTLAMVRKMAAEHGVSQQAIYFKEEAEKHEKDADAWLSKTARFTAVLVLYAVLSLFLHKIPFLVPNTVYETVQLAVSKILVFVTISYFVILSARNYLAHRHNAVVNRHRQNALMTYEALVKASSTESSRDVVLGKAADCIFAPQTSGFTKPDGGESGNMAMVSLSSQALRPVEPAS